MLSDQDYCLLEDGRILSLHGKDQSDEYLLGEVAFVPEIGGEYQFFGRRYVKPYQDYGQGRRATDRGTIRDPEALMCLPISELFVNKSVVNPQRVQEHFRAEDLLAKSLCGPNSEVILDLIFWLEDQVLGHSLGEQLTYGLTGSLALAGASAVKNPHDIDLVIRGGFPQVQQVTEGLQNASERDLNLRVFEYGKSWRMRLRTPHGLLCPFLSVSDGPSPLGNFLVKELVDEDFEVVGTVVDASQGALTPSVLLVESGECVLLVVNPDLRCRGDFRDGDRGRFRGTRVLAEWGGHEHEVLVISDGRRAKNTTPPWPRYYEADNDAPCIA